MVEGGELGLVEALDDSEYGSVHETDIGVGVTLAELTDADVVLKDKIFNPIYRRRDVKEK